MLPSIHLCVLIEKAYFPVNKFSQFCKTPPPPLPQTFEQGYKYKAQRHALLTRPWQGRHSNKLKSKYFLTLSLSVFGVLVLCHSVSTAACLRAGHCVPSVTTHYASFLAVFAIELSKGRGTAGTSLDTLSFKPQYKQWPLHNVLRDFHVSLAMKGRTNAWQDNENSVAVAQSSHSATLNL